MKLYRFLGKKGGQENLSSFLYNGMRKRCNICKLPMTASEGSCHIRGGNRRSGNYSAKEFPFSK